MTEHKKKTDATHEVKLKSEIKMAEWSTKKASAGSDATCEVWTHFVGNGSAIDVTIEDGDGKKIVAIKGEVFANYFAFNYQIPDVASGQLLFTAKLVDHGLEKKSRLLNIVPGVKITNLKWGQKEAKRGDIVQLTADTINIPDGDRVDIRIYEYDNDGAHDFVTKFSVLVKNNKIESEWTYEYHEDTDDIPTDEEMKKNGGYSPPEYFWMAEYSNVIFGQAQQSGLLEFMDWVIIELLDDEGAPIGNERYVLHLANGQTRNGTLDANGSAKVENIPPGKVFVEFPDADTELWLEDEKV